MIRTMSGIDSIPESKTASDRRGHAEQDTIN
jgi:hypothetical protein